MHEAYVVKIKELHKHSNADRLQCTTIFGSNVIVDLNTKIGDLGIYFPVDLQLGQEFAEKNNLLRKKDENGNEIGGYLDPNKRNIKAINLRGEKSDGLYLPISSLEKFTDISKLKEGDKITTLNGYVICEKYIPRTNVRNSNQKFKKIKRKKLIEHLQFQEHVDTEQLMYNLDSFKEGDYCEITLKLHGTSGRTALLLKDSNTIIGKIKRKLGIQEYDEVSGTRRVVLDGYDGGFYGTNLFRKKYHDLLTNKLYKGITLYYEIVGYVDENTLIMPECNNKKVKDKEFEKVYGETTKFTYSCSPGENEMYVYRMTLTTPDDLVLEVPYETMKIYCEQIGVKVVPLLEKFLFTTKEDLLERVDKYMDIPDPIGKSHVAEGVVVRIENRVKFTAFKQKGWFFKVLEGIVKDEEQEPDMEEAQEIE